MPESKKPIPKTGSKKENIEDMIINQRIDCQGLAKKCMSYLNEQISPKKEDLLTKIDFCEFYQIELGIPSLSSNGDDGWSENIQCPFHEDSNPSFGVNLQTGAFKCFACNAQGSIFDFVMRKHGCDFPTACRILAQFAEIETNVPKSKVKREKARRIDRNIVIRYPYIDENGNTLFQVVRYEEPGKEKTFAQWESDDKRNMQGVRRVLYRLPEVLGAYQVVLTEGEKDVETLVELGFTATTSPMGASNWRREYAQFLKNKDVVIMADNDSVGQKYKDAILTSLRGVASSIKVVKVPVGKDVTDWIESGATRKDIETLIDQTSVYELEAQVILMPDRNDGWPEPINIFDEFTLGPPSWQPDYSPAVITDFAFDEAERMGVRPEQIAGPAIISAAGVTSDNLRVQPKKYDPTWKESPRLWGAVIGGSGERKTPAKNRADVAINEIEKSLYLQYIERLRVYEAELQIFEALPKKERQATFPPAEPVRGRVICNDSTVEALRDILCDGGGATKLTCLWDELSGMLATFDSYRQSKAVSRDRSLYLELYNGGAKPIDRAGKVNIFVPNWSACISGTITPEVLSDYFGKLNADGLLQRFLLYRAERTSHGIDRAPNEKAEARFKTTIRRIYKYSAENDVATMRLSDEAQAVRESFEKLVDLAYHLPGNSPAYNAHLNKFPGIFCRLTLVYHLLTQFTDGNVSLGTEINGQTAEMAAKALSEYHLSVAREFYSQIGFTSPKRAPAKDLCGFILSKEILEISTRDILANIRALRGDAQAVRDVMSILEAYSWARPSKNYRGFITRWAVNPAVHKLYQEQARQEKERRKAAQAKICEAISVFKRKVS